MLLINSIVPLNKPNVRMFFTGQKILVSSYRLDKCSGGRTLTSLLVRMFL